MYWGGLLYPDAPLAGAEVVSDVDDFDCAAFDCAAMDKLVEQMSAAANMQFRTPRNLIISLRFYSQANPK
jgi:hypothetical protein